MLVTICMCIKAESARLLLLQTQLLTQSLHLHRMACTYYHQIMVQSSYSAAFMPDVEDTLAETMGVSAHQVSTATVNHLAHISLGSSYR